VHKVRILHIIPNFGPGGAERMLVNLLEAFDRERFEVKAVSLYPESGTILEKEIREKEFKVFYLNKRQGLDLRMIPQLYHLFCVFRPDVVHTHRYVLRLYIAAGYSCSRPGARSYGPQCCSKRGRSTWEISASDRFPLGRRFAR